MPSAISYYRELATALDDLGEYTVLSSTPTSVTSLLLKNAATGASTGRYNGAWVYATDQVAAGQQRRVRTAGYDPAAGTLTIQPDWQANPAVASTILVTRLFPIGSSGVAGEDKSYRGLVNTALAKLVAEDRVAVSITESGAYNLSVYPWMTIPSRLVKVEEPPPIAGRPPVDASWRNPHIVVANGNPFLHLDTPFDTASGSMVLTVLRPGHTRISEAESTAGVVTDSDGALPSVDDVRDVALLEAYNTLAVRQAGSPDGADWEMKAAAQQKIVDRIYFLDRTRIPPAPPQQQQAPAPPQAAA